MKFIILSCFTFIFLVSQAGLVKGLIGAYNAERKNFTNIVSIQGFLEDPLNCKHFCAGTIYDELWVVTAGHCIVDFDKIYPVKNIRVVAGIWTLKNWEPTQQIATVENYFIHHYFVGYDEVKSSDIGLIKLAKRFIFHDFVKPFPIAMNNLQPKGPAIMIGWGTNNSISYPRVYANNLKVLEVELLNHLQCENAIKTLLERDQILDADNYFDRTHICTGPLTGRKSLCHGDNGGPLLKAKNSDTYEVVGIASYTLLPCGREGSPSVYTNVALFRPWIESTIAKNS